MEEGGGLVGKIKWFPTVAYGGGGPLEFVSLFLELATEEYIHIDWLPLPSLLLLFCLFFWCRQFSSTKEVYLYIHIALIIIIQDEDKQLLTFIRSRSPSTLLLYPTGLGKIEGDIIYIYIIIELVMNYTVMKSWISFVVCIYI